MDCVIAYAGFLGGGVVSCGEDLASFSGSSQSPGLTQPSVCLAALRLSCRLVPLSG